MNEIFEIVAPTALQVFQAKTDTLLSSSNLLVLLGTFVSIFLVLSLIKHALSFIIKLAISLLFVAIVLFYMYSNAVVTF
jgi:hypothetical protein